MGTVHKLKVKKDLPTEEDDTFYHPDDEPEFDDGDGDEPDETICGNCSWWQPYSNKELQDEEGNPTEGRCRYPAPPWSTTRAGDWCRHFEDPED